MKNKKPLIIIIYIALMVLVCSWILGLFSLRSGLTESQVAQLLRDGQVKSFIVDEQTI